jgi:hypothetical protein
MPMSAVESDLLVLEERVEQRVFRDWREAGEALERIRDERMYEPEYPSFRAYVERRFEMHRQTAYSYIRAAVVARDLASCDAALRLPQRHAAMLYRFPDADTRYALARTIAPLSFREATRVVLDYPKEHGSSPARPPKHDADKSLSEFSRALHTLRTLDESKLAERIAQLDSDAEMALDKEVRVVMRRLSRTRKAKRATA